MFNLREIRNELGISQMHLSIISRVSRYRIHLHENGYLALMDQEIERIKDSIARLDFLNLESLFQDQKSASPKVIRRPYKKSINEVNEK